jgi:hypothetical protein
VSGGECFGGMWIDYCRRRHIGPVGWSSEYLDDVVHVMYMYACMCECIVYIYIYIYIYIMCGYMSCTMNHIMLYVSFVMHIRICTYICTCMRVHMCFCIYVYMYDHM